MPGTPPPTHQIKRTYSGAFPDSGSLQSSEERSQEQSPPDSQTTPPPGIPFPQKYSPYAMISPYGIVPFLDSQEFGDNSQTTVPNSLATTPSTPNTPVESPMPQNAPPVPNPLNMTFFLAILEAGDVRSSQASLADTIERHNMLDPSYEEKYRDQNIPSP